MTERYAVIQRYCRACGKVISKLVHASDAQVVDFEHGTPINTALPWASYTDKEFILRGAHKDCPKGNTPTISKEGR